MQNMNWNATQFTMRSHTDGCQVYVKGDLLLRTTLAIDSQGGFPYFKEKAWLLYLFND